MAGYLLLRRSCRPVLESLSTPPIGLSPGPAACSSSSGSASTSTSVYRSMATSASLGHPSKTDGTTATAATFSRASIRSPTDFMSAIAKSRRGDLSSISSLLGEDASWEKLNTLGRLELKKAGVNVKERRYFLWAREKFKQGEEPSAFAIDLKPPKTIRGWGARVQKGIRVRGRKRPGEK